MTAAVIVVSPCLGNCDAGLSRRIAVGDIVAGDLCCVICNCILGYRVYNFFSSLIFRQVFEAVGPVSIFVCGYGLAVFLLAVCKKSYSDALRTFSILIICIFPGLGSGDGSCFWSVGVSQSGYSSVLAVVGEFVTFWESFLCPGVLDCFSVCFFRKVRYSLFPIVLDAQGNGLSGFFTVCKKTYGNALRTFSILIFSVVPDLGYCCTGLSWSVAVGDVAAIVGCSVISYFLLSYGVGDFLAVCIFRKLFEAEIGISSLM